jgi:hypothetical protein
MPKQSDRRERRHQPLWDTLIRGNQAAGFLPNANLTQGQYRMFTTAQGANLALTNMEGAGSLPAGQTYLILAIRCFLYFRGCTTAAANNVDTVMYHHAAAQLYFALNIGNKEYLSAPAWYLPAGGGLAGGIGNTTDMFFTNGLPSHSSMLRLARSISLTPFQNFYVLASILPLGTGSLITDFTNLTAGEASIQLMLDGLQLRDVL